MLQSYVNDDNVVSQESSLSVLLCPTLYCTGKHSFEGGECADGGGPIGCMYGNIFVTYVNISVV